MEDEGEPPDNYFTHLVEKDEKILFWFNSDLDEKGFFGRSYLIVTPKRVITYTPSTGYTRWYPLGGIREVRFLDHLGGGEIELVLKDRVVSLIRFSRSKVADFRKAARLLEELVFREVRLENKDIVVERGVSYDKKIDIVVRLFSLLKPYWRIGLVALISSLIAVALGLLPPYLMKILIDEALTKGNIDLLVQLSLYLIAIYLTSTLLGIIRGYSLTLLGEKIVYDLRKRLYRHVQQLSLGFFDRYGSGRLISRISDDTSRIKWFLTWGVQSLIVNTLQTVGIGVIVFSMNPSLAIFALIPAPIILVGIRYYKTRAWRYYHKVWRRWADVNAMLVDTIPGAMIVKSFTRERFETERFTRKLWEVVKATLRTVRLRLQVFPAMGLATSISAVLVWWFGGLRVISGEITLGLLTAFVSYMWQFYGPINILSTLVEPLQSALTSAERIFELLDSEPEIKDSKEAIDLEIKGHIVFRNVYFGYEPYVYVLRNINLEIKPGEVVGIVGPSGSGKTTLIKLLLRFYDPSQGKILIDGVDLRKIKLKSLRRQIGIVQQEPILFSGSIAENIAYGKEDAEPEEIIAAAKAAYAHDFIMKLPAAYDTQVGERGSRLSGGERQRIAIARAIITNPKILILDEATSSVDTITEKQIQAALNNLIRGRTTIVIAHRLSTVKNADKIVVISNGQVVEIGKHEELLERNGLYAKLWRAQFEEEKRALKEKLRVI